MLLKSIPMVLVLVGLAFYFVLAGADFGAGFWQLTAGRGRRGERVREHAHHSMGPVWETNHVWLIFVLVVLWTCYPTAFASVASTLCVPLFIAALGIIFRGAAYALRSGASSSRESGAIDTLFGISSIVTPFALGAAIGAIASDRVPVGNAAGHMFSSWLNPTSILTGVLAVAVSAYMAAVYLAADAHRDGSSALERAFRRRALGSGVVTGLLAVAGILIVNADRDTLFDSLLTGRALGAVIVSMLAGAATVGLVYRRRYEPARYVASVAVAAIVAGWALARWPKVLPSLDISEAAAGHDTLVAVVVVFVVGSVILVPSMSWLFRLSVTGGFSSSAHSWSAQVRRDVPVIARPALVVRAAVACLIVGAGLLNLANGSWAHAVGVVGLLAFVLLAARAIIFAAISDGPPTRADA
jgi:cytochrome d ubiquinol oxidase subunit II